MIVLPSLGVFVIYSIGFVLCVVGFIGQLTNNTSGSSWQHTLLLSAILYSIAIHLLIATITDVLIEKDILASVKMTTAAPCCPSSATRAVYTTADALLYLSAGAGIGAYLINNTLLIPLYTGASLAAIVMLLYAYKWYRILQVEFQKAKNVTDESSTETDGYNKHDLLQAPVASSSAQFSLRNFKYT